ncbi:Fungalysin metallopeptidase-domain-containing protein [Mycena rosella]|uniref:Extracellular metalloproteinase n=1 Tax=Mycena rosella TaxID=1033263 RepID=A0AAD7CZI8_MYCRO|nr:Fungalysin metallopeptidase-domain-containing protein [Mycena rosella]
MVAFNLKFFTSIFLAIVYGSSALAAPSPIGSKHTTHRKREIARGVQLETYHPVGNYETYAEGVDHPLRKRDGVSFKESSVAFLQFKLGVDADNVAFHSGYESDIVSHAYLKQAHDGIFFANAVANVAINKDDRVVALGHSFVTPSSIAPSAPSISFEDAVTTAEAALDGTYNGHPADIQYFTKDDNTAILVHAFQVQNQEAGTWYLAYVDAHANTLVSVSDFVAKASYLVLPITKEILTQGFETLIDPQDVEASPQGWHWDGTTNSTTTSGNNAITFNGSTSGNVTSESGPRFVFDYPQDASTAPNTTANINAARVNNFYIVNSVHDISYRYGFTEAAFNFQQDNFGKGGAEGDRVTALIQAGSGIQVDNADFTTPPDGQGGIMRMFLWDFTSPHRDGAFENDIVVHENTHGISNRLTGGGTAVCFQTTEAGGMGEGWSDAMAEWTEQTDATITDYVLGQYVSNNPAGVRTHPYSTNRTTNPLMYADVGNLTEVHNIGEVWANMLHNVYAAFVGVHGFDATARTNPNSTAGNAVYLHLFIDSLAIQPCSPTFITARDAWIQADVNRYGGANKCTLWTQFASRGLGVNAQNHTNDATVPSDC